MSHVVGLFTGVGPITVSVSPLSVNSARATFSSPMTNDAALTATGSYHITQHSGAIGLTITAVSAEATTYPNYVDLTFNTEMTNGTLNYDLNLTGSINNWVSEHITNLTSSFSGYGIAPYATSIVVPNAIDNNPTANISFSLLDTGTSVDINTISIFVQQGTGSAQQAYASGSFIAPFSGVSSSISSSGTGYDIVIDPTGSLTFNVTVTVYAQDTSYNFASLSFGSCDEDVVVLNRVAQVPEMETLVLNWTFDNVTGSGNSSDGLSTTSDAKFIVEDATSGSLSLIGRYGWLGPVRYHQYPGQGDFYLPYDTGSINVEYVPSAKQLPPEVLNSSNMVEIRTEDDVLFTRDSRPIKHFYAVEKSPYAIISEEMIKVFGTIKEFNNLIGEPVHRYRQEYKSLEKLRNLYFDRIGNSTIDFEKFVDYFKWFDSSISLMLQQLVPASAHFSDNIRTLIESHVLERNKYWNKFPTIELKSSDPTGSIRGINELLYNWKTGSAPSTGLQTDNPYWWLNRAEREGTISSGDPLVDTDRSRILTVRLSALNRSFSTPLKFTVDQQVTSSDGITPLRITNIKNTSSLNFISASVLNAHIPMGNYNTEYEIVQTSGRSINNRWLIKSQGTSSAHTSSIIYGIADYTLQTRPTTKHIFVERFSSPGESRTMSRGHLDFEAEEKSSYNSMNFRNSVVRNSLSVSESIHTQQFGTNSVDTSLPNYHKVHGNRSRRIEYSGNELLCATASNYDNAFVIRPIPQSDLQYTWITASADITLSPYGLLSEFYVPSGTSSIPGQDIVFIGTGSVAVSTVFSTDFAGLNSIIYDPITSSLNILSSSTSEYRNTSLATMAQTSMLNSLLLHRNGPYQYPTWKQIRTGEHPIARLQKSQNILSVIDVPKERQIITNTGAKTMYIDRRPDTFTNYTEPAVVFRNRPMIHTFNVKGSSNPVSIAHTYANNISLFTNTELNNRFGTGKCDDQMYHRMKELYIDTEQNEVENPIEGFMGLSYREVVYPKEVNTGKKIIRTRINYEESAPKIISSSFSFYDSNQTLEPGHYYASGNYSDNGIDRSPLERRTFWHSDPATRTRWAISPSRNSLTQYLYSGSNETTLINSQGIKNRFAPSIWPFGCELGHTQSVECATHIAYNVTSSFVVSVATGLPLDYGIDTPVNDSDSEVIKKFSGFDFGELSPYPEKFYGRYPNSSTNPYSLLGTKDANFVFTYDQYRNPWARNNQQVFENNLTWSICYAGQDLPNNRSGFYLPITQGGGSMCSSGTFIDAVLYPKQDTSYGPHIFRTHVHSGKNPMHDSYEQFAADILPMAKEYTIVPEFRISEHMNYYVDNKGGNFREINDKILSNVGTELTQSSLTYDSGPIEDFYKIYSHSDFLKHFDEISEEHDSGEISVNRISLKCNAIKKLLPYNGFYPCLRTVQLAQLFSQSYGPHIGGVGYKDGTNIDKSVPSSASFAMSSMMNPFFSPGIMFNSIKSGIAMDYAVFTGSSVDGGDYTDTIAPNYRIAFESLLDIKNGSNYGGIPVSSSDGTSRIFARNDYGATSVELLAARPDIPDGKIDFYFDWNGLETTPLYKMAINNFLAETINLFFEDGKLKSLVSAPIGKMKSMLSGATYYMDVILKKSNDFLMYGGGTVNTITPLFHTGSAAGGSWAGTVAGENPMSAWVPNNAEARQYIVPKYAALTYDGHYYTQNYSSFITGSTPWNINDANKVYGKRINISGLFQGAATEANPGGGNGPAQGCDEHFSASFGTWSGVTTYSDFAKSGWLPPYFYGSSIARISYKANGLEKNQLDPLSYVLSKTNVEYISREYLEALKFFNGGSESVARSTAAWNAKSTVSSSINLFGISKGFKVSYDPQKNNIASNVEESDQTFNSWVISPKMEFPILNFVNQPLEYYRVTYNDGSNLGHNYPGPISGVDIPIAKGMWSGYGEFFSGSSGLFMNIGESFPSLDSQYKALTGSLIDIFGFKTDPVRLGDIASSKTISEAVVAIPFIDNSYTRDSKYAETTKIMGRNFFLIDRDVVEAQKRAIDKGEYPSGNKKETSISKLYSQMNKFVFPPEMNFVKFKDIQPFVMYVFEFNHILDKQDLADIWQNVMPKIAMTAEKGQAEVSHDLGEDEFFHGKKLPKQIRWMVFKVKQQAAINYFEKTADSKDDNRFRFDFKVGTKAPEYSYNWPYDYCSLVELAQIEAEIGIGPSLREPTKPDPIKIPGLGNIAPAAAARTIATGIIPTQNAFVKAATVAPAPKVVLGRFGIPVVQPVSAPVKVEISKPTTRRFRR